MPARLAVAALSVIAFLPVTAQAGNHVLPETVTLAPGKFLHPLPGEFTRASASVAAPIAEIRFDRPLEIMRHQVSVQDYGRCVVAGACRAAERQVTMWRGEERPVTGTSYEDALDYAHWLGAETGDVWRLPTDAEWAFAAGSHFGPEQMESAQGRSDPAAAWLENYRRMAQAARASDKKVYPLGHFGANENGLFDMSGNVWEWTRSCYVRAVVDAAGDVSQSVENCGVRVVEGRHRTYVTSFVRDAAGGGCSVGTPPDHLGFRLVREGRAGLLGLLSEWLAMLD